MTNEEIVAYQKREKDFRETEIGKLFWAFERAHERAWILDTESGFRDNVSDKRLTDVWNTQRAAREALVSALIPLAAGSAT